MTRGVDPSSITGKSPRAERHVPLVVVGAGEAGVAAAIEAAQAGVEVMLIDENPVDLNTMAMDVPLYYGQRMAPSLRGKAAMLERIVETSPGLDAAFDAGVDVQLGVCVWGAFRNSPTVREMEGPVLGLADDEKSWLIRYDRLIVAAGARDLGMAYQGWEKAGTMGANGAWSLLQRYRAFGGQRIVVLGSGALGLQTALLALERGVQVAGIVEVTPEVRGDPALRQRLEAKGVPFYTAHTVKEGRGRADEVQSLALVEIGHDLQSLPNTEKEIPCDTVVLALGLTPSVELLSLLNCRMVFRSELGGWVPETDEWLRTSLRNVYVAGDCAGVHDGMLANPAIAREQGRLAGIAAAVSLGKGDQAQANAIRAGLQQLNGARPAEVHSYYQMWLHALINVDGWATYVCQCEEVTRRELVDVQPPRYLNWKSEQMSARSLKTLLKDGPVNQDHVKRLTRAGMGYCQGRRCREQIALLLADEAEVPIDQIEFATFRPPARPLPLKVMWAHDEPEEMRDNWVGWFGVRTMFQSAEPGHQPAGFGVRGLKNVAEEEDSATR